jgi:serine/threonine-protein kinase
MGEVYEGLNLRLERRVAIKVMHSSIASDADSLARFEREAQVASRIGSHWVPAVYDMGDLEYGERYMVMEFLEGETLASRLGRARRLTVAEAARIAIQLLEGLGRVHAAGIVHRDLKPGNVFLARRSDGAVAVKILDFGVCKITRGRNQGDSSTGVGDLLGTPVYMSPEQLEHGPKGADVRSDLYAAGVILYRAASGQLPYRGKTVVDVLRKLREGKPTPLSELIPDVDPRFAAIVDKAIEWNPDGRFQSAEELKSALESWFGAMEHVARLLSEFLGDPPKRAPLPPPPASSDEEKTLRRKTEETVGRSAARKRPKEDVRPRQNALLDLGEIERGDRKRR